jgi:anhydro-N-acetylmuramic acid kinase
VLNNKQWLVLNNCEFRLKVDSKEWFSDFRYLIGIMTGTSADGVDISLGKFSGSKLQEFTAELVEFQSFEFPASLKKLIELAIKNEARTREIAKLNFDLAYFFAKCVRSFLRKAKFPLKKLDAVAVHGQTVWHQPKSNNLGKNGFTLQLVSLSALTQLLKVPVVGDFRSKDVAVGGEGAPLVPIFDYNFLFSRKCDVITINIGGIANITYLPKDCKLSDVVAFDTGPGNTWIDGAMRILFGRNYDKDGETAKKGKLNKILLEKLKSNPFVAKAPPKSTGREEFSEKELRQIIKFCNENSIKDVDIVTTLTHFTAWSIAENIKRFANPNANIIVSGGGARNLFLLQLLKEYIQQNSSFEFKIFEPPEAKESFAFAFLGYLRMGGIASNIPNVTGARENISLGIIAT